MVNGSPGKSSVKSTKTPTKVDVKTEDKGNQKRTSESSVDDTQEQFQMEM